MEKLYIKNMVCQRCINTVTSVLTQGGFSVKDVQLGEATIEEEISSVQRETIHTSLSAEGFDLLNNKNAQLIEQVKNLIIGEIHYEHALKKDSENYSDFLAKKTGTAYVTLSRLFSSVESKSIEKYIIEQKVERIKELLIYDELSISEIAFRLGYSSSQHLSSQFRSSTGMTPSEFKNTHPHKRRHLDHI